MLSLLLDENISHEVAAQVKAKRPDIAIQSIFHWRGGTFLETPDESILSAAREDGLTLVTYDRETILPLLSQWVEQQVDHHGIVFISQRSIASSDFGGLVRSLIHLWEERHAEEWRNRILFLRQAGESFTPDRV